MLKKRIVWLLSAFLMMWAAEARAQIINVQTLAVSGQATWDLVPGTPTISVTISGTWTGTVVPKSDPDGTGPLSAATIKVQAVASDGGLSDVNSITANGTFLVANPGYMRIVFDWTRTGGSATFTAVRGAGSAAASISVGGITAGAQPASDPHHVRCSDGAAASPCLVGDGTGPLTIDGTVTANLSATDNTVLDNIDTNTGDISGDTAELASATTVYGAGEAPWGVSVQGSDGAGNPTRLKTDAGGELQIDVLSLTLPNEGQQTMANSVSVAIASNQTSLPVDSELTTADLDTGAGTDTRAVQGLVFAASGGATLVSAAAGLPVNIVAGGGAGGTSSNFAAAFPAAGTAFGLSDGTNMIAALATTTQAENLANTLDGLNTTTFNYLFDGATWDRAPGNSTDGALVNLGVNNDVTVTGEVDVTPASPAATAYIPARITNGTTFIDPDTQAIYGAAITLTAGTVPTGGFTFGRVSAAAPSTTGIADDEGQIPWLLATGASVSQPSYGGVLASTGVGASGTGTLRVAGLLHDGTDTAQVTATSGGALQVECVGGTCSSTGSTPYDHGEAITLGTANGLLGGGRVSAAAPVTTGVIDDDFGAFWVLNTGAAVQQPSFAGVLAVAGNGASGTGVQRVTIANDSTGLLAQVTLVPTVTSVTGFNSTTMTLNAGAVGAGTPRVIIANDDDVSDAATLFEANLVAHDIADAGSPLKIGGYASTTVPTAVSAAGDRVNAWYTLNGAAVVSPGGGLAHYRTSAGSTEDEHEIKATAGTLYSVLVTNTNAAARYIRCYNLTAANTTPGTSTVFWGGAIPGNTAGAGFTYSFPAGLTFDTALTCAWTTGAADTDVAEVAANEIKATYTYR